MSIENPLRFLAAGDLHVGAISSSRLETLFGAAARHPEAAFFAIPGDLTDGAQPPQHELLRALIASLPIPFLGTMGNHDFHMGPDEAARMRFRETLKVESASYVRRFGPVSFVFLSSDGDINGCRVDIRDSLGLLEETLSAAEGPVIAFCHAPLPGTVAGVPGRPCFLSDDPEFGLGAGAEVRSLVSRAGVPLAWFCGHTHTPLDASTLVCSEQVGSTVLHTVNVSCPYFTGRDFDQTEPVALYVCSVTRLALEVSVVDAATGAAIREVHLSWH
jgi:3',5'-cyclic AMP phosphodiesterase CpdA